MRTLEELRQCCQIDEPDDPDCCWVFQKEHQYIWYAPSEGIPGKALPITRGAWMLAHQRQVRQGFKIWRMCGTPRCANPTHMSQLTPDEYYRQIIARGVFKRVTKRIIANRRTTRKQAKLTALQVMDILASSEPPRKLAQIYPASEATICRVRKNGGYACRGALDNPFAGLMR